MTRRSCTRDRNNSSTHGVSSIIWRTRVAIDPCLYSAKGALRGDHLGVEATVDCLKPENNRREIARCRICDASLPDLVKDIRSIVWLSSAGGLQMTSSKPIILVSKP